MFTPDFFVGQMIGAGLMGWVAFGLLLWRDRGGWEVSAYGEEGTRFSTSTFLTKRGAERFVSEVGHFPYRLRVGRRGRTPLNIGPANAFRKIAKVANLGISGSGGHR